MSAQALYRRWRPQSFADVYGQETVTRTLRNALRNDRLAHAYLFTGLRGTGKTSVARILAKAVNCRGAEDAGVEPPCNACALCRSITEGRCLDLIEIDAASNTGVDDVRELRDKIGLAPNEARYKVYLIDEVHMLSTAAFNALLKTLEEPPAHALFILATTEPHKIPDTILSRCQRHDFRRVPAEAVAAKLARICEAEEIGYEPAALEALARAGTGSMRDAESLLDQVAATGETLTLELVGEALGTPEDEAVSGIVDALASGEAAPGLRWIAAAMDAGADPRQLRERLLEHLRLLLLVQSGVEDALAAEPEERRASMEAQAAALAPARLVAAIHRVHDARPSPDRSQPALPLELALVESVLAPDARPAAQPGAAGAAPSPPSPPSPRSAPRATSARRESTETASGVSSPAGAAKASDGAAPSAVDAASRPLDEGAAPDAPFAPDASVASSDESADRREEATAPEPASEAGPATAEGGHDTGRDGPDLEALRGRWDQVVAAVARRDRNTAALLKDCRPVDIADGEAILGFYYEFHCGRATEASRQQAIAEALAEVFGQPLTLRLTVVPPGDESAATRPRTKADQAKADPVVRHAVDELGAKITAIKPRPDSD